MPPTRLQYRVDDRPPIAVTIFSALQHLALIAPIGLIFPMLVAHRAQADAATFDAILATSMLVLGLGTILQCLRWRGVGSGYLAPAIFTAAYFPPSLVAAEQGGLPLVCGMTIFAGLCEIVLSRVLHRLRPYLPAEIAGLAVTMIGVTLGLLAFRLLFGLPTDGTGSPASDPRGTAIGVGALVLVIVINIWGPRPLRIYAVLVALVAAWIAAAFFHELDLGRLRQGFQSGIFWLPRPPLALPAFDGSLAFEFAMGALASSLRAIGDITTCQKIDDPEWLRPELRSLQRGVLADGLGTMFAGLFGTVGLNTFSGSIGLSAATGIVARRVGVAIGLIFIGLAFLPGAIAVAGSIPLAVTGAILLFASSFVILNGLQVILSRLLDNRKILVVGLGFIFGLSRDVFPDFFGVLPHWVAQLTGSPLVAALLVAIVLNFIFRLGVGSRVRLVIRPEVNAIEQVHAFCQAQGEAWGARRDVMHRVTTALVEFAETAPDLVAPDHQAAVELAFDEYRIDALIRYVGRSLPVNVGSAPVIPTTALETSELPLNLPAVIMSRMASKFSSGQDREGQWLRLSFEH